MKVKIPYDDSQLELALIELDLKKDKAGDAEKILELEKEILHFFPEEKVERDKLIAEYNKISPEKLEASSEDYEIFAQNYLQHVVTIFVGKIMRKIGVTAVQAWAMVAAAQDTIRK